jgi:LuxR family maltose regulon positive regulatory protein
MDEIIAARFEPPKWMGEQVSRKGLLERLDAALAHRLTLIHAPAGYGKTSLLSQWRVRLDLQKKCVAWLTLERDDGDLARLVDHLALLLTGDRALDHRGRRSPGLPISAALSVIINSIERRSEQQVIILDDLHRARGHDVLGFLGDLVRLAPPHCHFVVASRDYPALGQAVLAAEGQVLEFGERDLRFSADEAKTLLDRNGQSPASDELDRILERTEGWAIAIQLASLTLRLHPGGIAGFDGTGTELTRYLSEQVLMSLPEDLRTVVMRTSLPERITGELADMLCERDDGWLLLENLEQGGVFLSAVDAQQSAYRYHQLFAEFLRSRFQRTDRATYNRLQAWLSDWFAERGMISDSVDHAISADDTDRLALILVREGGWRLIPLGFQAVLERALMVLPENVITTHPIIALAEVYLTMKQGDLSGARVRFDNIARSLVPDTISAELRTEMRVVGDTLSDYENRPVSLDDLLERESLLRTLPATDHLVLANIRETLGAKYFEGGWLERALQPALAAREHYRAVGSLYSELFTRFLEARIKRAQGHSKEAAFILADAATDITANFGTRSDLAANCAAFQAELLYEEDRVAEADELLDWCVPHMEESDGWVDVYYAAYTTQARIFASKAQFEDAWAVLARAKRVAIRRGLDQLELLAEICERDLRLTHGEAVTNIEKSTTEIGLDGLADSMRERSPRYRPVSLAAMMLRTKLHLMSEQHEKAKADLAVLRSWAAERGAGRLIVDVNILSAYVWHKSGNKSESRTTFDEAVGIAMFQDLRRPFIDNRNFVRPCLDDTLATAPEMDKVRNQFIKSIERSLSASRNTLTIQGLFNEAEAEVLHYLSQGHSNKEIARLIGMSPDTVKYRLKNVFKKIGVSKRRDAMRIAAERALLSGAAAASERSDEASADRSMRQPMAGPP